MINIWRKNNFSIAANDPGSRRRTKLKTQLNVLMMCFSTLVINTLIKTFFHQCKNMVFSSWWALPQAIYVLEPPRFVGSRVNFQTFNSWCLKHAILWSYQNYFSKWQPRLQRFDLLQIHLAGDDCRLQVRNFNNWISIMDLLDGLL